MGDWAAASSNPHHRSSSSRSGETWRPAAASADLGSASRLGGRWLTRRAYQATFRSSEPDRRSSRVLRRPAANCRATPPPGCAPPLGGGSGPGDDERGRADPTSSHPAALGSIPPSTTRNAENNSSTTARRASVAASSRPSSCPSVGELSACRAWRTARIPSLASRSAMGRSSADNVSSQASRCLPAARRRGAR